MGGKNPLVGKNDDELGPRFPPTSNLYDVVLQNLVVDVGDATGFAIVGSDNNEAGDQL